MNAFGITIPGITITEENYRFYPRIIMIESVQKTKWAEVYGNDDVGYIVFIQDPKTNKATWITTSKDSKSAIARAQKVIDEISASESKKFPLGWILGGVAVLGVLYFAFKKK